MPDQNSRSSTSAAKGGHARDLRFAGGISAGLISAILVGGALLAPVADWEGLTSSRGVEDTQTIHLADLPAVTSTPGGGGGSGPAGGGSGGGGGPGGGGPAPGG